VTAATGMLSVAELHTVDKLLGGSQLKAHSELQPAYAAWFVFELLGSCSSHPQLKHIARDEEVMTRLMTALEIDAKGASIAQFCGYVGCELAEHHPDRLASFLASPANADYMVSVLSPHLAIPEVGRLVEICAKALALKHPAVKHFLLKLQTAILTRARGERPDDVRVLCILIVSKALDGLVDKKQDAVIIDTVIELVRAMRSVPPNVLTAVAKLCHRRKLDHRFVSICLQKAEMLFVARTLSASCLDGSAEVKCLRMVIVLLGNRGASEGRWMPATLLCLSELAVKSIAVARKSEVLSELDKAACEAAELLGSSVGTRWPREEVAQCAPFKTREWHEGCKWLENSARYPSYRMPEHGRSVLQIQAAMAPPKQAAPPPVPAPPNRPAPPPAPAAAPPPPPRAVSPPPPARQAPSRVGPTIDPLNPSTLPPAGAQPSRPQPARSGDSGGGGSSDARAAHEVRPAGRPSRSPEQQRPGRRPEEKRVLPNKTEPNLFQKAWNFSTKVAANLGW